MSHHGLPDWEQRYAEPTFAYGTEPNDFLRAVTEVIPRGRVLCLAEGQGRNAVYLAQRGYEVTAVDQSTMGMQRAKQLAAERGVSITTQVADLAFFDLGRECWSGIVSIFAHIDPVSRRELHRRVVNGLKPGGVFVLEAYSPAQLRFGTGGPKAAELCMNLADLKQELAGLEFLQAQEIEREVFEGSYHTGQGAVVQILARKYSD